MKFENAKNVLTRDEMRNVLGGSWDGRCGVYDSGTGSWTCGTDISYEDASGAYWTMDGDFASITGYCCASCGSYC